MIEVNRVDHAAIIVMAISDLLPVYGHLGLRRPTSRRCRSRGGRVSLLPVVEGQIELLEPSLPEGTVGPSGATGARVEWVDFTVRPHLTLAYPTPRRFLGQNY